MYQVMARSKVSPSWGLVGYFTSMELVDEERKKWSNKWEIDVKPLTLDTPFVCEVMVHDEHEAWLQPTRALGEIQAALKTYLGSRPR